jgi:hypothetical protein
MDVKIHIEIGQFQFVEVECDLEESRQVYDDVKRAFAPKDGLDIKEWAQVRQKMITSNQFDPNLGEQLNSEQRFFINELKKGVRALEK